MTTQPRKGSHPRLPALTSARVRPHLEAPFPAERIGEVVEVDLSAVGPQPTKCAA